MDKATIRQLITQSFLDEAIREMLTLAKSSRYESDMQLQSARYHEYARQQRLGTESSSDLARTRNQITQALLELLEDLPEGSPTTNHGSSQPTSPPLATPVFSDRVDVRLVSAGTGDGGSAPKTAVWIGVVSLLLILIAVLFVPCPSSAQFFVFRLILAVGASGIGVILPGFLNIESGIVKAGGAIGLFVLVYLLNPAVLVGDERCQKSEPFTLTVSLRTVKPSNQYPDLKNAELWLWHNNNWDKATISSEGVADFKNLSPELIGKRVAIQLKGEFFRAAQDSLTIHPPAVTLNLSPDGSLERVYGKITDPNGDEISKVIVEVENCFDTTDIAGNYEFRIASPLQKTHYLIRARKDKFQPFRDEVWPANGTRDFSLVPVGKKH